MKKIIVMLAAAIMLSLSLVGCGSATQTPPTDNTKTVQTQKDDGTKKTETQTEKTQTEKSTDKVENTTDAK